MDHLSFVRYSPLSTLRQLIRKPIEAKVQLPSNGGDLQLGPLQLCELHSQCVQMIKERANSHA